ncbi:MAG: hypothetical protein KQJ78_11730 [Deltaproteobacteria bacterium]|nr:hypothetical protein [Deltaproteobacteria bacterium]
MANKEIKKRIARQWLNDIFLDPPATRAELEIKLRGADAAAMRKILVDELEAGNIGQGNSPLFVEIMNQLGAGHQKRRLINLALDPDRPKAERTYALMALGSENDLENTSILAELDFDLVDEMLIFSLRNLFMLDERDIGPGVVDLLKGMPGDDFASLLFEKLDEQRVEARVPAYIAYGDSLKNNSLSAYHPEMISLIEKEGHALGISLLEQLDSQNKDCPSRKLFQKAALKIRSNLAEPEPDRQPPKGFALISNCDGLGAVSVNACLHNSDDYISLANICVWAEREVRDGFYLPKISQSEFDEIIAKQEYGTDITFLEVSLDEAAIIVYSAFEQHLKKDAPLDLDAQRAIACLPRTSGALVPETPDNELLHKEFSVADYERMLDGTPYNSWFFDAADLDRYGVITLGEFGIANSLDELDDAARKLDDPVIKERLLAMNRHMAWWRAKNEDEELSAMHLQAIESISNDFENSPFVRAMVIKSFSIACTEEDLGDDANILPVGDPSLRRYLKSLLFNKVKVPTGKDMAALDFTEVAHLTLGMLFERLPSEMRPRLNILPAMAYEAGKVVAKSLQQKLPGTLDQIMAKVSLAIKRTIDLDDEQSDQFALVTTFALFNFAETFCTHCAVDCLRHPKQRMPEAFFSDEHPALSEE